MSAWKKDKLWSDRFLPEIKRALGESLIVVAPNEDDMLRNTDLMVLRLDSVRIACRVRTHYYGELYRGEFTIRAARPSGTATEFEKIMAGWGDYLFYGYALPDSSALCHWALLDLNIFRAWASAQGGRPGILRWNDDRTSFRAFDVHQIPGIVKETR